MSEQHAESEWISKAEAAKRSGIALRTVQAWARNKKVRTKGLLVAAEDVETLANSRTATGAVAQGASVTPASRSALREPARVAPDVSGELAATVFAEFKNGMSQSEVVVSRRLVPSVVRRLFDEFNAMADLEGGAAASPKERIHAVEARLNELCEGLNSACAMLASRLAALERRWAAMPGPNAQTDIKCSCGAVGYYGTVLQCTCCSRQQVFGFYPPR